MWSLQSTATRIAQVAETAKMPASQRRRMAAGDSKPAPGRTPPIYRDSTVISLWLPPVPPDARPMTQIPNAKRHQYLTAAPGCNIRDMGRLTGKAAIITGGEGSIGMATARAFAAEGARVFLAGISEPDLKAGAAALGEQAAWQVTDVTDSAQVKAAVDAAVERFGRLDVVIANAGIKGATGPISDYPEDSFDQTLAVHVRGAFLLAKHAVPYLSSGASI